MKTINLKKSSLIVLSYLLTSRFLLGAVDTDNSAAATPGSEPQTNAAPAVTTNANVVQTAATNAVGLTTNAPPPQSSAAANAITFTDHNIRFQFDGLPYQDVLTRFSQMVNKPLLADTKIEGTLAFNDPQSYSYPEALETLNLMLSMKGFMLVENDRYLRLVPLKDLPQTNLRILRGLDHTGDVRPGEVVTVVLALKNLDSGEIAQSITAMLSNAGSIAPLSRGKGLIITDHLANIKRIQNLLNEVDTASPVQRQMKTFNLLNASGAVLTDLLNKTFGVATAPRRIEFNQQTKSYHQLPPDANDYITAIWDEASRTLVLYGPADRMTMAEDLIKRFENKSGVQAGEVRIIYPQSMSAQELARMLRQATAGIAAENETPASAPTKAQLIVDPVSNRLIVAAPAATQLDEIQRLVRTIDVYSGTIFGATNRVQGALVTKVIRCQTIDPDSAVRILTDVIGPMSFRRRMAERPAPPDRPFERTFRVTQDAKTKSIILMGTPVEVQQALDLISQLDTEQMVKRVLRILPLKSARPSELMQRLRPLYQDQVKNLGEVATADALILPDENNSRLIVTATEAQVQLLENLVSQLDSDLTYKRIVKMVPLKTARPDELIQKLRQLYQAQAKTALKAAPSLPDPVMMSDETNNRLILTATESQLQLLEALISQLDSDDKVKRAMNIIPLKSARPSELMQKLRPLYQDQVRNLPNASAADALILPDDNNNQLIITAAEPQMKLLEDLVTQLDSDLTYKRIVRMVSLKTARPDELIQKLRQLYQAQAKTALKAAPSLPDPVMMSDETNNRLILTATESQLQLLEALISQLDSDDKVKRIMKIIAVKSVRPTELLLKLRQVYQDQVRNLPNAGAADALMIPDDPNSRLIFTAAEPQMQLIEALVSQLDSDQTFKRIVRIIPLKSARSSELTQKLRQLYQDQAKTLPNAGAPDPIIMQDDYNNRIILTATDSQLKLIEALVSQLDSDQTFKRVVRIVPLKTARPSDLALKLRQLYQDQAKSLSEAGAPDALIIPDEYYNRLILTATESQMQLLDGLISQLDASTEGMGRGLKAIKLKYSSATAIVTMLGQMYARTFRQDDPSQRVTATPSADDKTLLVEATGPIIARIEEAVRILDVEPTKGPYEVRSFHMDKVSASEMARILGRLFTDREDLRRRGVDIPQPRFEADMTSNTLLIAALKDQFEQIEQLIKEVNTTAAGTVRQLKAVKLKYSSAGSIATMLGQIFPRQFGQADPNQRVVATPSSDDKTIMVEATGANMLRIEDMIQTLDADSAKGVFEVRTYRLTEGNATELAQTLERVFNERQDYYWRHPESEIMQPRFEGDATSNTLIVASPKAQLEKIDQLIKDLKSSVETTAEIRTFRLKYNDPDQMVQILSTMLKDDSSGGSSRRYQGYYGGYYGFYGRNQPSTSTDKVKITSAPAINAIVVQGPPDKLRLAEQIINNLDKSERESTSIIQTVHLKKAQAVAVADAVTRALETRGNKNQPRRTSITPVGNSNSLLLDGPSAEVEEIMRIIQDLDQESTGGNIEFHIYKLENGNAQEISRIVGQMIESMTHSQSRFGRTSYEVPVTVAVDERSNSLIISASPQSFKIIDKLLASLDKTPPHTDRVMNFYTLVHADAYDMATKLQAMYADRPKDEQVTVESDFFSNAITVVAKRRDMPEIEETIQRLDEAAVDTRLQVRLVALDKMPAEQMAKLLQSIYPQMMQGEVKIVDKLPPRPREKTSARSVSIYTSLTNDLTTSTALSTNPAPATNVTQLTVTNQAATNPPVPQVIIAIDKTANALLLSGPVHELDQIQSIIRDLNYSNASIENEFRIYPLQEADPIAVARTLTELFRQEPVPFGQGGQNRGTGRSGRRSQESQEQQQPQPQQPGQPPPMVVPPPKFAVVAEPRTRSVIVRAKPTDLPLFESLIKKLDAAGLNSQLNYRLVSVENVPADKLLPLVTQLTQQVRQSRPGDYVSVIRDPRGGALFVVGRTNMLDQVETMIHELDTPGDYAEAEVRIVPLKNASAPQLAALLQEMIKPGARGEATPQAIELQEQVRRLKIQNDHGDPVLLDLSKPIKIVADPLQAGGQGGAQLGGNRLILTATPGNLKAISAVVAMMDSVPLMEGITAKLVHLKHADANMVSQTLNSIFMQARRFQGGGPGQGQGGGPGRGGRGFGGAVNVAIDQTSNTLILSGQQESLELALNLIEQLDRDVDTTMTEIRLFRLKYASASRLAPLLQSVFADNRSMAGTEGLRAQVTRLQTVLGNRPSKTSDQPRIRAAVLIQADDNTNILVVAARSDTMPLIEDVINTMDIPAASGLASIRIYPLQHADAATLQRLIIQLYQGPNASQIRREDRPAVTVDERTNALVVSGNDNSFAIVASLIERLDKDLGSEFREVRIIPLENADALTMATTLQRLLDARLQQKTSLGKQEADALKVLVIGDPRTNALLVGGSKEGFELVRSLVAELDKAGSAFTGQIRLIPLKYATAQALSSSLSILFAQRYQSMRSPELQRGRPIIIPDPRSNSLLVAANVEDSHALDALLEKLDRQPENPAMTFTVLAMQHNDSAKAAAMITSVFAARRQTLAAAGQPPAPQDQVFVEADSLSNALIVSASPENLDIIKGLLAKIDVEPVAMEGLIQTFTLKQADAQRASTMLRSLIDQGIYRPGMMAAGNRRTTRDAIAVTVDQRSNTLIISASPENILVVKELIKQIDSQSYANSGDIQLFQLKHARASQLATVLEQFFRSKRASEAAGGSMERSVPVTVTPDDRTNTLLVTGGRETFAAVERMVAQLDAGQVVAKTSFKVIPLKQATAAKLQATLTQLFLRRPATMRGEPPDPITVVADSWANTLVVGASSEDLLMVESLIAQLDNDQTEPGMEVQVLPLVKADVRRVAQTVQALYRAGGPGTASPVTVNVDERINALVVSAGQSDIKRIAELVKKLDSDQVGQICEIRIFPLTNARATQLAAILTSILNTKPTQLTDQSPARQSLLQFIARTEGGKELMATALREGVLITPDPRTNALIISAPVDYMNLLQQLINRLDTSSPQLAKIKVFNLKNADARAMSTMLQALFRLQRTGPANANDRTIQYTVVRPDPPGEPGNSDDDLTGASGIVGTAEENALTVTVDLRTNSLLVGGAEHYVALATEIIETLDASPAQERKSEVYRLKNSRALEIQNALANFTKQDVQLLGAAVGQQAMAQEMLDREVAIVAETNSNTLLISASPRYFVQIKSMIEQLDQPQRQVLIQVLLAEVTLDSGNELGMEWTYQSKGNPNTKSGSDLGVADDLKNLGGFSSAISGNNFNFLFRALETEGRLQVLSRPQILTSDNQEAIVNIGQSVPVITGNVFTQFGANQNQFTYTNIGVVLKVTPRISPDGFVKMDVAPSISQLSGSTVPMGNGGGEMPIFNQRTATTTVSVQSGQSILIGGLISTSDDSRTKRMPFLGKIPLLGSLFRSNKKTGQRVELLIMLTPQVLVQAADMGTTRDAKTVTREQLNRSTIQENFKNDPLQQQILEPIFPDRMTNSPSAKPTGKKSGKNP